MLADSEHATVAEQPPIDREQERALYAWLRDVVGDDALRYQLIAQKIGRTADGTAEDYEQEVALDCLRQMESESGARSAGVSAAEAERVAAETALVRESVEFRAELRAGRSPHNPRLQAWLDTIEDPRAMFARPGASPLSCGYSQFIAERSNEFERHSGAIKSADAVTAYMRHWANQHLAERLRVKPESTLRGEGLPRCRP